jgi:hypothetical protein
MRQALRRYARRMIAAALNDGRRHEPYSYGWLNSLCGQLVSRGAAFERRPAYTWGVIHGAALGRALGIRKISVLEFGVAGGRGLVALEEIAERISSIFGISIDVYGFDTGEGLPAPSDPRDLPNLYSRGHYRMDVGKLQARLRNARLLLGQIKDTIGGFINSTPAPIAFASVDVDLYTSTVDAFALFEADTKLLLPRVQVYFDDILGLTFGDNNGERAAILDFNAAHQTRKISPVYGLRFYLPWPLGTMAWSEQMYMLHALEHPLYSNNDGLIQTAQASIDRH